MKKKIMILFCTVLLLTGCGKIPKLANGEEAVVSFTKEGKSSMETLISNDELFKEMKETYALSVLVDMIDTKIFEDKYADKISEATKEAEDNIVTFRSYFKDEDGVVDETQYLTALSQYYGISSEEAFKDYLYLGYFKNIEVLAYAKTKVTTKEIKEYYKNEIVGDISASHILITADVTDSMSSAEKAAAEKEALAKANSIIKELDKSKDVASTFAKLAKENSKDTSTASEGGDLGYFNTGDMVSEFETAAYKLKVGKYTAEPVKTSYGYHIILKTGEKDKESLENVKDEIIETLAQEKVAADNKYQVNAMSELRKSYGVEFEDDELKTQYSKYINYQLNYAEQQNESTN